jgi:hypothetical protein
MIRFFGAGTDHDAPLANLRQSLAGLTTVQPTDYRTPCEHAKVIVIQLSAERTPSGWPRSG